MNNSFNVPMVVTGIVMMAITAFVILGGVKSIGKVVGLFVPFMIGLLSFSGVVVAETKRFEFERKKNGSPLPLDEKTRRTVICSPIGRQMK